MTSPAPSTPRSRERRSRRELVAGALLVALFTVVFLWTPIVRTDAALVPTQAGQRSTLTHVKLAESAGAGETTASELAASELVPDVGSRYVPWTLFSRASVREGRLPAWNDLSGAGAPHFANPDAAVLSPFTWPWYVLDVRAAALVSALLRSFALGFFTFLFLMELRVAFAAAVAGAVAFQFAGVQVIGLLAPASAAAVLAPAGLFVVERMARATERVISEPASAAPLRPGWGSSAALAAVVAVAFLSGGFATFLFSLLLVVAYAVARFGRIGARDFDSHSGASEVRRASVRIAGAFAVGACITAIQVLPWLEDMDHVAATSEAARASVSTDTWTLEMFPDLATLPIGGSQADDAVRADGRAPADAATPPASTTSQASTTPQDSTNQSGRTTEQNRKTEQKKAEVLAKYVGSFALFLALLGAFFARRRRAAVFFAFVAVVWFAATHGVVGRTMHAAWFGGSVARLGQGQVVFALSIAVLAALALDRVVASKRAADARIAFAFIALGACTLWALRTSADALVSESLSLLPEAQRVLAPMSASAHVDGQSAVFCAGLLCVALALGFGPGRGRSLLVLGAGAALFAQAGWITGAFPPLAPVSTVYPRTDDVARLVEIARGKQVLFVGADRIEPDAHLVYGLHQLCASDPERTLRSERLLRAMFAVDGDVITRASERALRLFGVGLVLEKNRFADSALGPNEAPAPGASFASAEILPATPVVQHFVDVRGKSGPLGFEWITNGWKNACTFRITLDDASTGERIVDVTHAPGELRPRGQTRLLGSIDIPSTDRRAGRKLVLTIATDDAVAGRSWSVLCRGASSIEGDAPARDPTDWSARQGNTPIAGRLALQPDDDPTSLQFEEQIGSFAVRSCADAARYRTVSSAFAAGKQEDAWFAVMRNGFDPRALVVLEGADPKDADPHAKPDESAGVDVAEERAGRVRLHAHRARPGWLVADLAWCPGWRATVDGASVPLHCANYAFTALPLAAGEHTVELDFAPASVRAGSAISIVGLVLLSCMMFAAYAHVRSDRRRA